MCRKNCWNHSFTRYFELGCKDFIEITDANYVPNGAADETVTDVVIAPDGKRDHPYMTLFKKIFFKFLHNF